MQLHYSLFLTPFLTGFVGYFTNYLAIKMLFRPHKRRWYSLGWQGVIPRNRGKLAKEIGKLVGNELLQEKDILKSIKNEQFQSILSDFIRKELNKILFVDYDLYLGDILRKFSVDIKLELLGLIERVENDRSHREKFDELLHQGIEIFSENLLKKKLKDVVRRDEGIPGENFYHNFIKNGKWQVSIGNIFKEKLHNTLYSGYTIYDILPENISAKINDFSLIISAKLIEWVRQMANDPVLKIKITKKLIDWKNNYFRGSFFGLLKLGILNIFLSEEKIAELVENGLPKIINGIVEDKVMLENIKNGVSEQIVSLLSKPLHQYVEFIGIDNVHAIINKIFVSFEKYLRSEKFFNSLSEILRGIIQKNREITLKEILDNTGFDLKGYLCSVVGSNLIFENKSIIASYLENIIQQININSIFRNVKEETYEKIAEKIQKEINLLFDRNIPSIIRNLNIPSIVEERINTLNLYQVEGLLFSFMADQFKWINILGFILGFLFGMMQSIMIVIYGG